MVVSLVGIAFLFNDSPRRFEKVSCLVFSPDGEHLAVAKHDARDANTPLKRYLADVCRTVSVLHVPSLDSETVIEQDFRRGNQGPAFRTYRYVGNALAFLPDSKTLAVLELGGGTVKIYDVETMKNHPFTNQELLALNFSVQADRGVLVTGFDEELIVWNLTSKKMLQKLRTPSNPFMRAPLIEFSPNAELVAAGGYDEVKLWSVADGSQIASLDGLTDQDAIRTLAFHPLAQQLVVSGLPWLRVYDFSGSQQAEIIPSGYWIHATCFSPDGKKLAVAVDQQIDIFDGTTWERLRTIPCSSSVACLTYSPDGNYLATGDYEGNVILWNAQASEPLRIFEPHGRRPAARWKLASVLLVIWCAISYWLMAKNKKAGLGPDLILKD